ncbi:hypothetical protein Trydic_g3608 [Trypoxylus dichotomus]
MSALYPAKHGAHPDRTCSYPHFEDVLNLGETTFCIQRNGVATYDDSLSFYRSYRGEDCELQNLAEDVETAYKCRIPTEKLTPAQYRRYATSPTCHICEKLLGAKRDETAKSKVEVKIHTDSLLSNEQKKILINQNELNSLDILAANSDEGLRLVLDIKTPTTLSDASEIVTRHFHNDTRIRNLSKRSDNPRQLVKPAYPQVTKQSNLYANPNHRYVPPQPLVTPLRPNCHIPKQDIFTSYSNYSRPVTQNAFPNQPQFSRPQPPQNSFPSQPIPIQSRPVRQQFPTNRQVFGKPPSQRNVFAPKNNRGPRKSEPMDISSARTNKTNNLFRPTGPRNFTSQELNNVENYSEESYENPNHNFAYDQSYETSID